MMNRQIRHLGVALLVLFALLFLRLNQVQVLQADELTADPLNTRRVIRDFGQRRGEIRTADDVVIAESVEVEGDRFARERRYPHGALYAHITGYFSFEFGATGVEQAYNDELAGRTDEQRFESFFDFFGDGDTSGDLILTVDSELQTVAANALGSRRGSVVALDPATGAVLAFHTWPSFDPATVSTTNLDAARDAKVGLDNDPLIPLLTRAHRELFAPGSTFKVITAASAIENGRATATDPVFPEVVEYPLPLTEVTLRNFGGSSCGGDLAAALARSCNTAFAELGAEYLGPDLMIATAENFGFNDELPFDLALTATSRFPDDYGIVLGESDASPPAPIVEGSSLLAQASIGQYDVAASPLHMALVGAGLANGGEVMTPHLLDRVVDSDDGEVIIGASPELWRRAVSPEVADIVAELMIGAVENGTGSALARPGLTVGAKTGTAQTVTGGAQDDTHAWVIVFAGPAGGEPEIALAVMVEAVPGGGQQTGGAVAVPIAAQLLDAWFR